MFTSVASIRSKVTTGVEKFQVDVKKRRWARPKRPMDVKWGTNQIHMWTFTKQRRSSFFITDCLHFVAASCNFLFLLNEYRDWCKYQIVS